MTDMEENEFTYEIKDKKGLHVRPACKIIKAAKGYKDTTINVTLLPQEATAKATSALDLLTLHAKCGDTLKVSVEGSEAEGALAVMREVFEENL